MMNPPGITYQHLSMHIYTLYVLTPQGMYRTDGSFDARCKSCAPNCVSPSLGTNKVISKALVYTIVGS